VRRPPEQKAEALRLLAEVGLAEAARRTGIPEGTIASWGSRTGVQAPPAAATRVATEAHLATVAARKARVAEGLVAASERMLGDLFAPTIQRKAVVVGSKREVEIVEIRHPTTTPSERRTTVDAITTAMETVQLLTGEATERIETLPPQRTPEIEQELAKVIELRTA